MAITLLIIFSSLAITGYYFLANKLGFTQNLQWTSTQAAELFFLQDYDLGEMSQYQIKETCLCNDKQVALLKLTIDRLEPNPKKTSLYNPAYNSKIGLVYSHGNRWLSYLISNGSVKSCQIETKKIILSLNDYALPKLILTFTDIQQCTQWHTYLENLTSKLKQS